MWLCADGREGKGRMWLVGSVSGNKEKMERGKGDEEGELVCGVHT